MDIELTNKQHNKIKRAIKALNDVRAELARENPDNDVNWYLEDSDNLNLMGNPSHTEDHNMTSLYDNVIECYSLDSASGGGW